MSGPLSGVAIIICIAFGILTVILLFIFGKRQIMRFSLKSRRGPHVPVGHDAPKWLEKQIERHLNAVCRIKIEPKLLSEEITPENGPPHFYRMKTVHDLNLLELKIAALNPSFSRCSSDDLRTYLLHLIELGPLSNINQSVINKFVDIYEHARHEPLHFSYDMYNQYQRLLQHIISTVPNPSTSQTSSNTRDHVDGDRNVSEQRQEVSNGKIFQILHRPKTKSAKTGEDRKDMAYETSV